MMYGASSSRHVLVVVYGGRGMDAEIMVINSCGVIYALKS